MANKKNFNLSVCDVREKGETIICAKKDYKNTTVEEMHEMIDSARVEHFSYMAIEIDDEGVIVKGGDFLHVPANDEHYV